MRGLNSERLRERVANMDATHLKTYLSIKRILEGAVSEYKKAKQSMCNGCEVCVLMF